MEMALGIPSKKWKEETNFIGKDPVPASFDLAGSAA